MNRFINILIYMTMVLFIGYLVIESCITLLNEGYGLATIPIIAATAIVAVKVADNIFNK